MTRPKPPPGTLPGLIAGRLRVHYALSDRELARALSLPRGTVTAAIGTMTAAGDLEPVPGRPRRWRLR